MINTANRKAHRREIVLLWLFSAAAPLVAQTTPDTGTLYSGIAFSVAGIIIMVLLLMLYRRIGKRNKSNMEDSGLDLMSMKQKNLLTPEEMRMVSAAIARRMAEKETRRTSNTPLTPATLLHDPEVLRLQQEALARREQSSTVKTSTGAGHPAAAEQQQTPAAGTQPAAGTPQQQSPAWNAMPAPVEPPAGYEGPNNQASAQDSNPNHASAAAGASDNLDDIELPPEVQQLADAGILTEEEIENVKRRLRNRR